MENAQPTKEESCHHIETGQFICKANQLTSFYIIKSLAFKRISKIDHI